MMSDINLPKKIVCHNWWISKGNKMSKSLGNIIDPKEIILNYGSIPLRLYLLKENLLHADHEFLLIDVINTYNNFFINKFCNLIHRVFSIAKKHSLVHIEKIKGYYDPEFKESIYNCNSKEYFKKFFEICDSLNREVEEKVLWINISYCDDIVKRINSLIDYVYVMVPSFPNDIHQNSKRFVSIEIPC